MATIKNFEDLEVWQLSKEFDKKVYKQVLLKISDENISLKNQLNKSSGSIMDNIAEGFGREGNKELRQFLAIAKGSVNEAKSQLYRVVSRELLPEIEVKELLEQTESINKKNWIFYALFNSNRNERSKIHARAIRTTSEF